MENSQQKELRYPVGMQSFRRIIEEGYVYVDKTWCIPLLEQHPFYFLGRPRRFGKSLLLSMLKEYFEGNRELFRGLAIDRLRPEEWAMHPVFHIDLNNERYGEKGAVVAIVNKHLERWEEIYGDEKKGRSISERFEWLVIQAYRQTGQKAVILIDEYDKPLTDNILNDELYGAHQADLRGFYSSLKTLNPYIKMALLTGVTKFGKLNVFSGLNNLFDISLDEEYAAVCGITEEELHSYMDSGVAELASKLCIDRDAAYRELKRQFDGYHFSDVSPDVYNPFSLIRTLASRRIQSYWFETGTPKMLVDLVIANRIPLRNMDGERCLADSLGDITRYMTDPIPLLYQTGYLSIKSYDPFYRTYTLGFPNREVQNGFIDCFMKEYAPGGDDAAYSAVKMSSCLRAGDADGFLKMLNAFFASMPYDLRKYQDYESFWQTVMYVLLTMLGYHTEAEHHTSEGAIDLLVRTPGFIYVMELKVADRQRKRDMFVSDGDGVLFVTEPEPEYAEPDETDDSAEVRRVLDDAVRQISERHYADPFASDGRKIIKIAIVFSAARHRLAMARIF